MKLYLFLALVSSLCAQTPPTLRAGLATTTINPPTPAWLVGFAARTQPASVIGLDLHAKALYLEQSPSRRALILTADLLGFTERISNTLAQRALAKHGLARHQIFFFASHTHSGPAVLDRLTLSVADSPAFHAEAEAYTAALIDKLDQLMARALAKTEPVTLASGWTSAPFAINRRVEHLAAIRPGETHPAPVDHRVPVLRLARTNGQPLATLFGYACHSTVLTGDTYEISGDYPGYAQQALEEALPGSTAFFVLLAAGDQRAHPRGTRALARQHGRTLAQAVLEAKLTPLPATLTTDIEDIRLPFASHTREAYLAEANSTDPFAARRGRAMLAAMDQKRMPLSTAYPIQALRLGTLTLLALPGEVVVDYALTLRDKYGPNLITAGYASFLPGYIPSLRLQREGGYEAGDSMMYFLQPGWFTDQVEPLVLSAIDRLLRRLP